MEEWPTALEVGTLLALLTVTVVLLVRSPRHAVTWVLVAYTVTALTNVVDPEKLLDCVASDVGAAAAGVPNGVGTSRARRIGFWYVVLLITFVGGVSVFFADAEPFFAGPVGRFSCR